ncbi:S49 family peptidase [Tessaracoccus sp. OS52]|uniref:S49 family peptidase n=1 Tax=Tessaracoccus sp. OS52 TaxID=2886691 RepID=UPI001D103826|nr:S49 family peptidase [Tessaracoccus sp. OS52]MCC2593248.1 S49 family peptidase [Tessaracoccus sp. OS52]
MNPSNPPTDSAAQAAPGYPPPAPLYQQAPLPPRQPGGFRRGFGIGTGIGLGLTAMVVALSVIGGIFSVISLGVLVGGVSGSGSQLETTQTIWGDPGASGKLRAIDVSGAIMTAPDEGALLTGGTYGYEVADLIDGLEKEDAAALVLLVNTPGGSITGSKAISDAIVRYQERTAQKVLVHVQGMSASGGVYSTAPADLIYADHGSIVGSIGVIYGPFVHYDGVVATSGSILESGVTTTGGITQEYFTKGTGKDWGQPFRELTAAERQMIDDLMQPEYERFVEHVATHRGIDADRIVNELGAAVFEPGKAEAVGLIDGTLGRDEFYREAATQAGLDPDDTVVEALAAPGPFESLLGIERVHGAAPALEPAAGELPFLNRGICGGTAPLVFAGDVSLVCG